MPRDTDYTDQLQRDLDEFSRRASFYGDEVAGRSALQTALELEAHGVRPLLKYPSPPRESAVDEMGCVDARINAIPARQPKHSFVR
jgi:hypothetical protein